MPAQYWKRVITKRLERAFDHRIVIERVVVVASGRILALAIVAFAAVMKTVDGWAQDLKAP